MLVWMGETPLNWLGDCQLPKDPGGDCPGELPSTTEWLVEDWATEGVMADGAAGSIPMPFVLRCMRCFSSMSSSDLRVNGFGKTSSMPVLSQLQTCAVTGRLRRLTVLEVHLYIIASNVRGHSDDGRPVKLPDDMAGRHSVKIWHDDVHEDHVILDAFLYLIYRFQTIELYQG